SISSAWSKIMRTSYREPKRPASICPTSESERGTTMTASHVTMKRAHATNAKMIAIEHLRIPEKYVTPARKVDDEILRNSIKLTGVQQPLVVVRISDTAYWVVDGIRRLRIAESLGMTELPCVLDHGVEDVDDEAEYRNRIRFILDEHRQDLLPTQRAALIKK